MKIDRSRVRKSTSEVPLECQQLIERLQQCSRTELLEELSRIHSWTFGKCELLHWAQVLDVFDRILGEAAERSEENKWILKCDTFSQQDFQLLICILRFTSLLIEHSFSRHLYNSMEHLIVLLESNDMAVVLEVLNLLYMFSKRSNFITRLKPEEKTCLQLRLQYLAESWGGKENGFGLADCCNAEKEIPASATTLHVEFHQEEDTTALKKESKTSDLRIIKPNLQIIHIEHVDKLHKTPAEIMKSLVSIYYVPPEKEIWLFTHVRLATHFADYHNRLKSVQARLQALSVMVYSNDIQNSLSSLLYNGILEELVEVVELQDPQLTDIKCAALRTLTAIIHLDRSPQIPNRRPASRLNSIIDVTGASQYHGFLPVLVRNCISSLTSQIDFGQSAFKKMKLQDEATVALDESSNESINTPDSNVPENEDLDSVLMVMEYEFDQLANMSPSDSKFPVSLTTALFSFLYHLASYESGGEALVSCGMMESLLQVINWQGFELDHITFVTRAVRVIDLITNIDMTAFQIHGGLHSFISRLDIEINFCKRDQLYQIKANNLEQNFEEHAGSSTQRDTEDAIATADLEYIAENAGKTCLPQRAALLKSMLNFLKKAFQESTFAESIRHLMEGTLPNSLKNIIANAEYYGPSLFLLATDVVTVYVYQEPSLLSALQDNGLTDVVLHSLLVKEVPATREVLGSLPNVFSALCLNNRGLETFAKCKPFDKLFNILLSPNYLPAMRRRRSSEVTTDTACNLGNAMDELMRHQPSLRQDATCAIITLLEELVYLGTDPKFVCWRPHSKSEVSPSVSTSSNTRSATNAEGSSDEEEEDEEEASTSSQNAQAETQAQTNSERQPIALIDYILNAMKFIDAILSNNSTDDHCREFVENGGVIPLLKILGLPNLPVDCPVTNPAQAVATVCKSILNLAHEPFLFSEGLLQLSRVLESLKPLYAKQEVPGGSKLLLELANATDIETAFSTASVTPLLHAMNAAHGYVIMFVHICRTGQTEIRNLSLQHWGSEEGHKVLKGLADLYTSLVWESTLLLAYCSDDLLPSDCDFTREDIEKLNAFFDRCEGNSIDTSNTSSTVETLSNNPPPISMDIDCDATAAINNKDHRSLKYIKPLLGASSRLGRALAELFGLLVKLCVGSPIRQRRGQNIVAAPPMPSVFARNVATALNLLLAEGLDCDRLPPCPTSKCRLTFLICSVGFTSPMLFDERRYPYHLMLKKFVSLGGQDIFFKSFKWAITAGQSTNSEGIESSQLPEGTLGFLDAWLTLLEKMVNPKAILDSPHVISSRPSHSYSFDPLKYLIKIHRTAFEAVMMLWGKNSIPSYGARTTETLLTILKHIFRGEKIIKEKLKAEENKTETASSSGAGSSSGPSFRELDDNLRQLIDMGFSREHAIESLLLFNTLEQATDYLLSNPPIARISNPIDVGLEEDQVQQAIAISLGCSSTAGESSKENSEEQDQSFPAILDEFTNNALEVCLKLVEVLPETVHKVCELLVTIMKRNGRTFRDNLLDTLISKIKECIEAISFCVFKNDSSLMTYYVITESQIAKRLANYVHLYILFFEVQSYYEMKIPCGYALNRANLLEPLIDLMCHSINMVFQFDTKHEPKWLAPCFLLLDAISKVATCTNRKLNMHMSTNRIWRWYDLVTGKWTHYSNSNNKLINEAYWNGEQNIRVTCGRKRYTVTFANMVQMNDETGNNRPITMTLMTLEHPSCSDINGPDIEEPLYANLLDKEEQRCIPVPGLTHNQKKEIVKASVKLIHHPLDKDLLHSALQICVRFTRDFEIAKLFVKDGGVKCLLKMRQLSDFGSFGILATILIRHALEEPNTLKYAIEKVIRGRTLATIPPPYKDLIYLTRQIGGAVTRDPEAFYEVATNILRVDTNSTKGEAATTTLPLKVEPPTRTKAPPLEDSTSVEVISDLLDALLKPLEDPVVEDLDKDKNKESKPEEKNDVEINAPSTSTSTTSTSTASSASQENTDEKKLEEKSEENKIESPSRKPMLPKSVILKILADAVVSFGPIAKLITEYKYKAEDSEFLTEDMSALAFIFDKILPATDKISDSDCSTMCRMLIAALASSNHSPEAQIALVSEVKVALTRALYLPESSEKHNQVQHICGIISTMIDNCPLPHSSRWASGNVTNSVNNIVKLMIRRGVFGDLAKITHYLDLSSPHTPFTANAALKPLESLSRTINQPGPSATQNKSRKNQQTNEDNTGVQSGTSTEGTNAQGDDIEDTENTEHDISAVASSLENNSMGTGELDNALEEMMEHILEHRNDNSQGYNDVPSSRTNTMDMDIVEECTIGYDHERDATEELMSTDSGESDSNPSDQVDDEGNDDNEGDDDNIDDTEENDDNNYEDDDNNDRDRRRGSELLDNTSRTFTIATDDRDNDILMIQYNDNALPRMIRWNENGFAVPILDENNPNDHTAAITHPLLISRTNNESNQNSVTRNQRVNRTRRYQYLFSPRNPNPPVILQRLLGPHDSDMASVMSANDLLGRPSEMRESARVVVMDNFGIIPSNEEQIDFVDQSGYLFGPSLAATLGHIPPVLHWWNMESKLLDLDSVHDCTTYICNKLIPTLIKYRNEEMRNKKAKEEEENSKKSKQVKGNPEIQDEYSEETVVFNFDEANNTLQDPGEQNKQVDEDIDGVPITTTDLALNSTYQLGETEPEAETEAEPEEENDGDIDGIPIETSDTSNDRSEGTTQNDDIVLSPLLSFVRSSNESSQSNTSETTHNAAVQTTETSDNTTRNTDDFNSRAESEIRTDSESSNPFEVSLPAYIRSHFPSNRSQEDNEIADQQRNNHISYSVPVHPLRAIFEETVNQHLESLERENQQMESSNNAEERSSDRDQENTEDSSQPASEGLEPSSIETATAATPGIPGPSTSSDEEIPEGVDPSFLEALPPEMRREVLEQHRILCLQQRIASRANNALSEQEQTTTTEVSPEFLAALPPALQEEVLTQQRLEQQRQAAARVNPNEPVDAGAFFETLQPSLRTMILSDMEDSQMSALPPDLAAEAQTLRRDWYVRNRQMAQERFLQSNLTTIYRHSRGRQSLRPSNFHRGGWGQWSRDFMCSTPSTPQVKIRGRQLLDHEGLACLLILLFTDDTNLNKLRLHRVIRNLCYYAPTREWIINALLSIIEKSVHVQPDDNFNRPSRKGPRPGPLTSKLLTDTKHLQNGSHWLTIRMEAALGCAANVFILNKATGKKCDKSNGASIINIHPQAAPIVCRNTLDLFTSLAKAFPSCLLPVKFIRDENEKNVLTPVKVKTENSSDFWDILLRLDSATKKGKSIQKNVSSNTVSETDVSISFEQTVFGKLLNLLSSPVVNRNMQLTDNLLKLLSVTTSGMSDLGKPQKSGKGKVAVPDIMNKPPTHALNLAVNVITYKNCSEEGLEFITNLLLNLANTSLDMSFMILNLLLNGAVEIGNIVENQIRNMLKDLKDLINNSQKRKLEDTGGPSTSKGVIFNRFTNEQVIVTASTKVKTACELQLPSMVPLTSKSSSQIFFLRVLRVIVQIRNSIKQSLKKAESNSYDLAALSEQLKSLNTLWETLSECLLELEHAPDHHAVLVLQPSVEAFFLVHSPQQGPAKAQKKETKETEEESMQEGSEAEPSSENRPTQPSTTQSEIREHIHIEHEKAAEAKPTTVPPEQAQFLAFAEKHRTVLNQILRQSTAHLADGPFAVLVDHTRILDFDIKRRYFRTELERMDHGIRREETAVHVRRSNIFEDSFRELFRRPPEEWKNRFYIVFEDEEGQDAGGLLREWYVIISRDIFNPMYALFTVSPGDRVTYMINSASHYNSNHLCYYKFVGRVIAKAIYDNKLLECYFTRSFYKHILGISVKYTDMESEDYSFYRGLVYLMENNINNLGLDLTFSTEISEFGVTETRDLIPNGRHIPVTEENKMEYVRLVCQMKMTGAIKQQLNSFLEGFYDIIPMRLISIFNEQELELLISGLPNVDIDDLKANTEYHKYQTNSLQIQWFWRALRSFDQADRAKFLQFVTGTSKVPLQGFGALEGMNGVQKFQIHRDDRSTDRLPSAHTCFNQLDLPVYETYDKLRAYLLKAIHECSEGFGFA